MSANTGQLEQITRAPRWDRVAPSVDAVRKPGRAAVTTPTRGLSERRRAMEIEREARRRDPLAACTLRGTRRRDWICIRRESASSTAPQLVGFNKPDNGGEPTAGRKRARDTIGRRKDGATL
ncbi:hypothetical protein HPB50_000842 [Hyalomma asiaticum]|uniref:Uncharacterized protein n=1 Tax=Hyalomma asiaticum TaxID=266040 RepID=A0ACB7RXU5_HYAAI|nr:hypothetical protein HPB50_000842 [Hyalomma asiaticum]